MPESPGRLIAGQYRLIEQVGRGGFAVVWRARDDRLRREVAAKQLFLPPHFTDGQRAEHRERTLREARSAARLTHPGVVTVHDVVEHDGIPWIIMEFVAGPTLGQLVRTGGPLPPARVAEIGLRLLDALRAAHAAGIVHRDVKPSNVIIGDRRVVLGDFGIARIEDEPELTGAGIVMGAPSYTAPERARGEPAVAASDLWSLGATLFYAVEGRRAFRGPNANATFHAIVTCAPAPTRHAGPLAPVLHGLLRKDVRARMSAAEAAERLHDIAAYDRPPGWGPAPHRGLRRQATDLLARLTTSRESPEREPAPHRRLRQAAALPARRTPLREPPECEPLPHRRIRRQAAAVLARLVLPHKPPVWPPDPRPEATRPTTDVPVVHRTLRRPVAGVASLALLLATTALGEHHPAASLPAAHPRLAAALPAGAVLSIAFSPDGNTLATGGADHAVRLWNVVGRRLAGTLAGHEHPVSTTVFSPDGRTLATGGDDGTVIVWNPAARHRIATLGTYGRAVGALAFGPYGATPAAAGPNLRTVATLAPRSTVRLWSVARPAAFSPDGSILATGGDHRVHLWDVGRHWLLATVPVPGKSVNAIAFSPDGQTLACATGPTVLLWNTTADVPPTTLDTQSRTVKALAFSPDGRLLATAGDDATVRLWNLS
jgi:serine/threonine protein kinase